MKGDFVEPSPKGPLSRIVVPAADLPTQIRVGDEPARERFDPTADCGEVLSAKGLWTTTLRRHGPLWHLHLPEGTDRQPWWRVVPQSDARIARIDHPRQIDLLPSGDPGGARESTTVAWDELAEQVDAVWLTERGHDRLQMLQNDEKTEKWMLGMIGRAAPFRVRWSQRERYIAFERWASGCVLWLRWCFESIDLYRHARPEELFVRPFTRL